MASIQPPTGAQLAALTVQYERLQLDFAAEGAGGPAWRAADAQVAAWEVLLGTQHELVFRGATDADALQRHAMALVEGMLGLRRALADARASQMRLRANTTAFMTDAIEVFLAHRPPGHALRAPGATHGVPVDVRNPALGAAAAYATDEEAQRGETMMISIL